uniref:Uncharacterized protein n=1 Tax=Arundo donax TaxID=35708 RepID=A0A0A9AD37_ARUDO
MDIRLIYEQQQTILFSDFFFTFVAVIVTPRCNNSDNTTAEILQQISSASPEQTYC